MYDCKENVSVTECSRKRCKCVKPLQIFVAAYQVLLSSALVITALINGARQ